MHAEREALVKTVFPALREVCEQRGVVFCDVDLRWGVTAEQARTGEVVAICLEESAACRPYFIGLLGERYGWVPEQLPAPLRARHPELEQVAGCSLTEMEMRMGVLNDGLRRDRAAFYLRGCAPDIPRDPRQERLKKEVRNSGALVREPYGNADELASLVHADLLRFIDADFPANSMPDPEASARLRYKFYAATQHRYFAPPINGLAALDRAAGSKRPLVVLGTPGAGKSALLLNWCRVAHERLNLDEELLVFHIGHTVGRSLRDMLAAVVPALGLSANDSSLDTLRRTFREGRRAIGDSGSRLLVLDGLDQLSDGDGARELTWLPEPLPPGLHVLASCSPGRSAEELLGRDWDFWNMTGLSADERGQVTRDLLHDYKKELTPPQLVHLTATPVLGQPLLLHTVLEELRVFGSFEHLEDELASYSAIGGEEELMAAVLARFEGDFDGKRPALVRDALSLLACAREGLAEPELLDLLAASGAPLVMAHWLPLRFALRAHLAEMDGVIRLATKALAEAVRRRYLVAPGIEEAWHRRLASYFKRSKPSARAVREHTWQLARCGAWEELGGCLTDPAFLVQLGRTDWRECLQAASAVVGASGLGGFAWFDARSARFEKRLDAVALVAYILEELEWDAHSLRRQIRLGIALESPEMIDALEQVTGQEQTELRADIAEGHRGFWTRVHRLMMQSPYHRLRLCRVGAGIMIVCHATSCGRESTVGPVMRSIDYNTENGAKFPLFFFQADERMDIAQKCLNLAGAEVGHGVRKSIGTVIPHQRKKPTLEEIENALAAYNHAYGIYAELENYEHMLFILGQVLTLARSRQESLGTLTRARLGWQNAVERDRRETAAKFAVLEAYLVLELREKNEASTALRHMQYAREDLTAAGIVAGLQSCEGMEQHLALLVKE
jgi:hypothetical protein